MKNDSVITDLEREILKMKNLSNGIVEYCNQALLLCRSTLISLKRKIELEGFQSKELEIQFFKITKQIPFHNLVYYSELKSFELQFPKGDRSVKEKCIQKKLDKLNRFFVNNLDFVQYVEQGLTHLDEFYFTRKYIDKFHTVHSRFYFLDPNFNTSHDLLLAKLKANERLVRYFENRLKKLGQKSDLATGTMVSTLKWSGSKTEITELIYGLYCHRVINDGKAGLKEIAFALVNAFDIELGDIYKTFSEIRSRKKSRTKFLDDLSISLIHKMEKEEAL